MTSQVPSKVIHLCPDEVDLVILALRTLKPTTEGRKHGGRLNWLDAKFCSCRDEETQIWPTA